MIRRDTHRGIFSHVRCDIWVGVFLVLATLAVYGQVRNHAFVNYDDDAYVTKNRYVRSGLSVEGIVWAFTATHSANWHPLTWLSHMLDYQLYGMNAGGHHLTHVFFHLVNSAVLFLVLFRMTGECWRSGLVSALFALHPLHVESVAWVSERKDVLSTFFWMWTMWAYACYTERLGRRWYVLVLVFFVLGLMSKPMLVTLPFVLLLIDYWPLGRLSWCSWGKGSALGERTATLFGLVWEKAPLFAFAVLSSVVTFLVQQRWGAVSSIEVFPLTLRAGNMLLSYVRYILKMIVPHGLAVFYPYPSTLPLWWTVGSGLFLVCSSVVLLRTARRFPYLAVGWLWYLGTLVPVIGVVQVGSQAMADRYTYVPLIGLFILVAWGVFELVEGWRYRRMVLGLWTGMVILGCMLGTWVQVRHWRDSIALFEHALRVTDGNYLAHNNLGTVLGDEGRLEEALGHYTEALRIKPDYAVAHHNLGIVLVDQGRYEEGVDHFLEALRIKPDYAETHYNLGVVRMGEGRLEEALGHYTEAVRIQPDYAEAHNNLGIALASEGRLEEALGHYTEAVRIQPDYAEAHNNLGIALASEGRLEEALGHLLEAVRIKPDYANAYNNLGMVLASHGQLEEAVRHFSEAVRIQPDYAEAYYNLGVVRMGEGRLEEAVRHFSEAVRIQPDYAEAHDQLKKALAARGKIE